MENNGPMGPYMWFAPMPQSDDETRAAMADMARLQRQRTDPYGMAEAIAANRREVEMRDRTGGVA